LAFVLSIFKYFLKSPKKRKIRVCLNRIESMSLLWKFECFSYSTLLLQKNWTSKIKINYENEGALYESSVIEWSC
jgi:hypothetical protein